MNLKDFLNLLLKKTPLIVVGKGDVNISVSAGVGIFERGKWTPRWKIEKFDESGNLYGTHEFEGNSLLNEGITELLNLLAGLYAVPYSSANTYIGVGDGTAPAEASQTGLQGSNTAFAPMEETYPQVNNQTITFRATFGSGTAAFGWNEFTVVNGSDDTHLNLCRRVENHSTKPINDTWVITVSITIS